MPISQSQPRHELLKYFTNSHLTNPTLKDVSSQFGSLALFISDSLPPGSEKTTALRKLIEAKDAAVRSALDLI